MSTIRTYYRVITEGRQDSSSPLVKTSIDVRFAAKVYRAEYERIMQGMRQAVFGGWTCRIQYENEKKRESVITQSDAEKY